MVKDDGTMKYLILLASTIFPMLFFAFTSLVGVEFGGSDESPLYMIACVAVNLLVVGIVAKGFVYKQLRITGKLLLIVLVQMLLPILFLLDNPQMPYVQRSILFIFAFSAPVCYVGYYMGQTDSWGKALKWLDVLMLLITASLAESIQSILVARAYAEVAGEVAVANMNYQAASYYAAFSYALNLILLTCGHLIKDRFKIFQNKHYPILSVLLLFVQIILCLMSGGRGGFVLIVTSSFATWLICEKGIFRKILSKLLIIGLIGLTALISYKPSLINSVLEVLEKSTKRTFAYISSDGIDMNETSGRGEIYENFIAGILDSPICGYGLFGYNDVLNFDSYPHNIFIEILAQGGFLYLFLFLGIVAFQFAKYKRMIKYDKSNIFLIPFICYAGTMLMFSGSYMTTGLFWFLLVYIYTYRFKVNSP